MFKAFGLLYKLNLNINILYALKQSLCLVYNKINFTNKMKQFYLKLVIKQKIYLIISLVFLLFTSCFDVATEDLSVKKKASPIFDYFFNNEKIDSVFYKINLPGSIDYISDKHKDFNGSILFRKKIDIRDLDNNYSFIVEGGIDDYDATYLNGHLIGTSLVYNSPRKYIIPKDIIKYGENLLEIKFHDASGFGGFRGRMYLKSQKGNIISISGTWEYKIIKYRDLDDNVFSNNPNLSINPLLWNLELNRDLYSSFEFDDFFWNSTNVPVFIKDIYNTETDLNGLFWFRKEVIINDIKRDYMISIAKGIDDSDEVYFNGSLVGGANCYNCPRNYVIKKELLKTGKNIIAILISDTNGDGGILSPILLYSSNREKNPLSKKFSSPLFFNSTFSQDKSTSISEGWKYKQIYHFQNISILTSSNQNVFDNEEFLYFLPNGKRIDVNNIISKSLINNYFSIPNLIIILSLLIITALGTINYKLLRKKKDKQFTESKSESQNYIFVRANRLDIKVLKSEILYVEAVKDYVKLVTINKNYLIRKNLKSFNKDVLDESFIRVSRSIIVNINKITFVDRNIVYLSDLMFKIGSNYTEGLNKLIKK